jgi:hypothetical protein
MQAHYANIPFTTPTRTSVPETEKRLKPLLPNIRNPPLAALPKALTGHMNRHILLRRSASQTTWDSSSVAPDNAFFFSLSVEIRGIAGIWDGDFLLQWRRVDWRVGMLGLFRACIAAACGGAWGDTTGL